MKTLSIIPLLFSVTAFSADHDHRHQDAHVHGAATLAIAFEKTKGEIEFKAAAEGVLGFEHQAKTDADKKKLNDVIQTFDKEISNFIIFDTKAECSIQKKSIGMIQEKNESHSDFQATYSILCKKSPMGSNLKIDFSKLKGLHDIDVTLLVDEMQKSLEIKDQPISIELK